MDIVYKLMVDCIERKDYSHAQKYLFCYYPCINSINEKRLVPNENLMNTIKKLNSIDIDSIIENAAKDAELGLNITPVSENSKSFIKKNITPKNLYICYNFTRNGTISEENIISEINNDIEKYQDKFKNNIIPKIKYRMGKKNN